MPAMEYESEYGIDVGNRFAGLPLEIDDPIELIQRAQALKTEKKQTKGAKGAQKTQEKVQPATLKETVIEDIKKEGPKTDKQERPERTEHRGRGRGGRGTRARGRGRGAGGDRPPREGHGDGQQRETQDNQDRPTQRSVGGERRGFGERRGGFGERGRFGGDRQGFGGERQADRKNFGGEGGNERRGFGAPSDANESGEDSFGRRGGGRGRPRGRGRGRGRGREYDRHSGSDRSYASSSVKASDKREGSGAFNWGSPQDEIEASEEANTFTPIDEEVKGSWADAAEQSDQQEDSAGDDATNPKEDEAKEMTLDEYKKLVEKEKPQLSYNVRQANEGEKAFPRNAVTLKKLSEDELESDSSLFFPKRIIEEKIKTSGRFKEVLPFDIKFAAIESRLTSGGFGGGRGNRRGRGVRGRGGGRRGRRDGDGGEERSGPGSREAAVVDSYDEDFPNLR